MVAANLKAETMSLMDKREALEIEMNSIIERLSQPNGPGISGNLVDSEGFPRSDIDVSAVRADRHRLAELRNDYRDITEKIDKSIQVLHSARLTHYVSSPLKNSANGEGSNSRVPIVANAVAPASSHASLPTATLSAIDVDTILSVPFALVDEIADASPTAEDGLQLGDQIVKFGSVASGDSLLSRLASEAQSNQGRAIPLVVLRQGALINLSVTPRAWHGRGLLGCHFRIL